MPDNDYPTTEDRIFPRPMRIFRGRREIGTAEEHGLDDEGGKYVTVCKVHSTVINADTKREALSSHTIDFCEECMEEGY